jgi:hypothetical protein
MHRSAVIGAEAERRRLFTVSAMRRYWLLGGEAILALSFPVVDAASIEPLPPTLMPVMLPDWAADTGVDGALLVPAHCIADGTAIAFERTDWLGAAFWYLNGSAERAFETLHGPIHSYSFRLKGWDTRMWDRAWANRIALFLRRCAARIQPLPEHILLGELPQAEFMLTHDVDAVYKSWSIRVKQSAFHGFNAVRSLMRGRVHESMRKLGAAWRFATRGGALWYFNELVALERRQGLRSHFFVYGGASRARAFKLRLLDPSYDCAEPGIAQVLRTLSGDGFSIGLHQSFDSWNNAGRMLEEKACVERAAGAVVTACRQHWLRFSWQHTWESQQAAGLTLDATLGFNDRPGFRNGAALRFHPWRAADGVDLAVESVPMVLMDSHLYDYADLTNEMRERETQRWLDEVRAVGGVASVNWHQHVLGPDYGWRPGYEALLAILGKRVP